MLSHVSFVHQCNPELMHDHIPEADNRAYEREWEIYAYLAQYLKRMHQEKLSWSRCFIRHVLQCNSSVKGLICIPTK